MTMMEQKFNEHFLNLSVIFDKKLKKKVKR